MKLKSKILIIAGSDSSGGAGIQADIKTVTSLGSYALTAITAVTTQNTKGVKPYPPCWYGAIAEWHKVLPANRCRAPRYRAGRPIFQDQKVPGPTKIECRASAA